MGVRGRRLVAFALVGIQSCLLAWGAIRQSPTCNEVAHLVAGLSYWDFGRFDVYRVNPPLTKMIAALPVLAAHPRADWTSFYESPGARPEFEMGKDFVAANGERSLWLVSIARWSCIPFAWLGAWSCYSWARDLYGGTAGLLALTLWTFCPNILAHAQLVTPDAGATAFGLAASYSLWCWLKKPVWNRAILAGCLLGLAELTKFTWIVLFALWPVTWVGCRLTNRRFRAQFALWCQEGFQLSVALLLALNVINLGYGFEGSFQRLDSLPFVSRTLGKTNLVEGLVTVQPGSNRFADCWLGCLPVPLPRNFVIGLDLQKKDLEHFSQPSYLHGQFRERGWWYYYVYAAAIKIPLGTWLLFLLAAFTSPKWRQGERNWTNCWRDILAVGGPLVTLVAIVSSQTGLTSHFRYALPALPFAFILASRVAKVFEEDYFWPKLLVAASLSWSMMSSLWIYPHSLSYFNEFVGGPNGGADHLLGSNLDWGQDLLFLRDWLAAHPEAKPLRLVYYGPVDPRDMGFGQFRQTLVEANGQRNQDKRNPKPEWLAISVELLRQAAAGVPPDLRPWNADQPVQSGLLVSRRPDAQAGYSIHVYRPETAP
jgi:hypothetical protein